MHLVGFLVRIDVVHAPTIYLYAGEAVIRLHASTLKTLTDFD